jgi:hypothetical protein
MVSGLPIFRISVFCSFILDPDTCPKCLNSLIRSSYSEISVLIIEQLSACWKSFVFLCEHHYGLWKNPEYQWWFCQCIYCSDADVEEVTLFWLVAGHWILPSHWFKIQ